jgi:HD-GYP domain-containing protein (c-di-GMP phosphodiesterase class II)
MDERYDEHYINSVTALGDTIEVVTTQAVFNRNGMKLLDKGARINSAMRDKLVKHKLIPDIDQCLSAANGVSSIELRERAREILENEPRFQQMRSALNGVEKLLNAFYSMPLNAPLTFKLTVAREQRPEIFEHSIQMTLIALFLAIKSRLPDQELATVAAASMLHDIGELHINPALLQGDHPLNGDELRHVYVHPMTAFLILQAYPQFHPEISTAVFEHHERLDGSGYPRGLKGEEISQIGKILMLAEAVTTLFEKSWRIHGAARLSMMLRMNRRKLDAELVGHLVSLLHNGEQQSADAPCEASVNAVLKQLDQLADVFRSWRDAREASLNSNSNAIEPPLMTFVNRRLVALERTLLETGFHTDTLAALTLGLEDDDEALAEIVLMTSESRRQVSDILKEVRRRWAELKANGDGVAVVEEWIRRAEKLLRQD